MDDGDNGGARGRLEGIFGKLPLEVIIGLGRVTAKMASLIMVGLWFYANGYIQNTHTEIAEIKSQLVAMNDGMHRSDMMRVQDQDAIRGLTDRIGKTEDKLYNLELRGLRRSGYEGASDSMTEMDGVQGAPRMDEWHRVSGVLQDKRSVRP